MDGIKMERSEVKLTCVKSAEEDERRTLKEGLFILNKNKCIIDIKVRNRKSSLPTV